MFYEFIHNRIRCWPRKKNHNELHTLYTIQNDKILKIIKRILHGSAIRTATFCVSVNNCPFRFCQSSLLKLIWPFFDDERDSRGKSIHRTNVYLQTKIETESLEKKEMRVLRLKFYRLINLVFIAETYWRLVEAFSLQNDFFI